MKAIIRVFLSFSVLLAGVLAPTPAFAAWEAMRATVSKDLFRGGVNAPITQNRSVSDYVSGTAVNGTALTTANVGVDLMNADNFAGIWLRIDSETNSFTLGVNNPRQDISVNIWATSYTRMTSWKPIFFQPHLISTGPAQSQAWTNIDYQGIGVEADGLFWRLKERVAERKAWEQAYQQKASNEQRVSQKAATEMNGMLDSKADPMMESLNQFYMAAFYKPYFLQGRIPGSLNYSTTTDSFSASVFVDSATAAAPAPPAAGAAFSFRVHEDLLNATAQKALAGKTFNEEDLEEQLVYVGLPTVLAHYKQSEAQVSWQYCATNPLTVHFSGEKLSVDLCADSLQFKDAKRATCHVKLDYDRVVSQDGGVVFGLEKGPAVACADQKATDAEVAKRFARVFPGMVKLGPWQLPEKLGAGQAIKVIGASLQDGWAAIDWRKE